MLFKIGIYTRVSTDEQAQVFEGSLESQKYLLEQYVATKNQDKNWGKVVDYYCDAGFTAGNEKRPAYKKILEDSRTGKINMILVTDITRFTRDRADFSKIEKELKVNGVKLLAMRQEFLDTDTPGGRLMMHLMVNMAQFEREQVAERVAISWHARSEKGLINGTRPILGFSKHPEQKGTMIVNEEEAVIVRQIFQTFLECGSKHKTAKRLNEMGIYPKVFSKTKGSSPKRWNLQSLGNFFKQLAYIGIKEINKQNINKDQQSLRPWQRYSQVVAPWAPIVDKDIFYEVQKILNENAQKERSRWKDVETRTFYLSHLLECNLCGRSIVGQSAHNKKGDVYRYYFHSNKYHGSVCDLKRINAEHLESIIFDKFKGAIATSGYFEDLGHRIASENTAHSHRRTEEQKRAAKRIAEIQSEIDGIWRWQKIESLGEDALNEVSTKLNMLASEKKDVITYLDQLKSEENIRTEINNQVKFVEVNMKNLVKGWSKAPPTMKKRLLNRLIQKIKVSQEEIFITFWMDENRYQNLKEEISPVPTDTGDNLLYFREKTALSSVRQMEKMVARDGIEPPTQGFSILCSTN